MPCLPWVAVLDFKSMYPSIMIAQNICSTTLVRDGRVDSSHNISPATSTRYVSTDERNGLVPRLLSDLMARRDHHKAELKKARESGDEEAAFLHDSKRLGMAVVSEEMFLDAVHQVVQENIRWLPPNGRGELYIRPLIFGSGAILGVAPAPEYTFLVYAVPVG